MPREWKYCPYDGPAVNQLAQQLNVSPLLAQVLLARGYQSAEQATSFLNTKLTDLHDPSGLPGITEAVDRITDAIEAGRRITIYGDYDVDGVTATSLLWACFTLLNARVDYYIPSRLEEGYGINSDALRSLHEEDPDRLMISVDCGIASIAEAELASSLGLELIVTDHHHIGPTLPEAACLVHPRLPGEYPFPDLSGVGVAFKLAWAICQKLGDGKKATPRMREFLKEAVGLTSIGTIADVVPLRGENRAIVRYGLEVLREKRSIGLDALFRVAGQDTEKPIRSDDIAFGIAPRINAAGRMNQARLAVELLTTESADRAAALAVYLDQLNKQRQTAERKILKQAKEQFADNPDWESHAGLVLAADDWHAGIIGIVASRVAEHFERPAILISIDKKTGIGQGSGRSFAGFDLYEALNQCQEELVGFGGHQAAAGLRIEQEKLDAFRNAFQKHVSETFAPKAQDIALQIDAEVRLADVTRNAVYELDRLGPFGAANRSPMFAATSCRLASPPKTMGEGGRHLAIEVEQHGTSMRAVAFGKGEWAEELNEIDGDLSISFATTINSFRGFEKVELRLIDWKSEQSG